MGPITFCDNRTIKQIFTKFISAGGALGYIIGGGISESWGWRWAFRVWAFTCSFFGIRSFYVKILNFTPEIFYIDLSVRRGP